MKRSTRIITAVLLTVAVTTVFSFLVKDSGRYEIDKLYASKLVSAAVICDMKGMTVEQRVVTEIGVYGAHDICVERRAASSNVKPEHVAIRYRKIAGYAVEVRLSYVDQRRVDRTAMAAGKGAFAVYVDGTIIRRFMALGGGFDGDLTFWVASRKEADDLLDKLAVIPIHKSADAGR